MKIFHIFILSILGMMTVPRRKIKGKFHPVLLTSLVNIIQQIPSSLTPWSIFHTIISIFRRPKAKTVMMLSNNKHPFHSGFFTDLNPLFRINLPSYGSKAFKGRVSISPLHIIKSAHSKTYHCILLQTLPRHVFSTGYRINRSWSCQLGCRTAASQQKDDKKYISNAHDYYIFLFFTRSSF